MGQVISLQEDRHRAAALLLPWYATGRIDAADRATVERHLAECEACRTELAAERRLAGAVATIEAPGAAGWEAMAARLGATPGPAWASAGASAGARGRTPVRTIFTPTRLRWLAAAQFAALLVLGADMIRTERDGAYRALSGEAPARAGNVLAMFRADASEADLRRSLNAAGARLVDGPTSANAYVLEVPGGAGGVQMAALRTDPNVTLAEPIAQAPAE